MSTSTETIKGVKHTQLFNIVRITFGIMWAIDAAFKWQPAFLSTFVSDVKDAAVGQPGILKSWILFWASVISINTVFFAGTVAVIETLLAIALILGIWQKITYILGAIFSLVIWSTAEGFGGPYTSNSTDIGTSIIYALVFVSLLVMLYFLGTGKYSVDNSMGKKFHFWKKLSEF